MSDNKAIKLDIKGFFNKYFDSNNLYNNYSTNNFLELLDDYQNYNMIEVENNNMPNFTYDARNYSQDSKLIEYNENNELNHFNEKGLQSILNNAVNSIFTKKYGVLSKITLKGKITGVYDGDGGNTKIKKEILGKERCIYKKTGDRKEYVKYKGYLITVKDYKKIISVKKTKK